MAYQALAHLSLQSAPPPGDRQTAPQTGRRIGAYVLEELLGKGGMGEVYRGHDTRLRRTVAIKVVSAERAADRGAAARLAHEARVASSLSHPGIVAVHDIGEFEGRPFIVMELVQGESLATRLHWRPLSIREALNLGAEVAEALAAAHAAGVIHRDLKPQNIMLTADGRAKIVDFGLGTFQPDAATSQPGDTRTRTIRFSVEGTAGYMAPEQAAGRAVDMRADQFALGVILYEMVSGRRAFARETDIQTLSDIIDADPAPLKQVCPKATAALVAIVDRCLQKHPQDRYGSTLDLAHDLRVAADEPSQSHPAITVVASRPRRVWAWPAAAAAALAALLIGAPHLGTSGSKPGPATAPALRYIAVLPFVTLSSGPSDQALADGLVETLTSSLTMLERFENRLRVVPATEVRREGILSAKEARQAVGATLAISGSLRRDDNSLQLTLNLIDTGELVQLRSRAIDLPADQHRELQNLVAQAVAGLLDLELAPEARQAMTGGGSSVPGAYELLALGRGYLQRFDRGADNIDLSLDALTRAVAADPGFALAHASAGEAYWRKYELSRQAVWIDRAVQHAERALSINSRLAPIHVVLSMIARGRGRYEEAVAVAQRAVELDPVASDGYRELGRAYDALDRPGDAEATYRKAVASRPNDWLAYNMLGSFYYGKRRWPDAIAAFKQVIARTPDNTRGYNNLGAAYFGMGSPDEAAAMWERSMSMRPTFPAASNLGLHYYRRGQYADAGRAFEKAVALSPSNHRLWRNLGAALYWAPGERDKARSAYERAVQLGEQERQVNPRQAMLQSELADAYSMLGRKTDTLEAVAAVERLGGDAEAMFNVAGACEQVGERALALVWLRKAVAAGYPRESIAQSPGLAALRADPEFGRVIR